MMRRSVWIVSLLAGTTLIMAVAVRPVPPDELSPASVHSLRVTDRNGIMLREYLSDRQGRSAWRPLDRISPHLRRAVIALEDKRFRMHPGVDPLAVARALWQNLRSVGWVSGASTITQQTARAIHPRARTLAGKAAEAWFALRLERTLSKDQILEQYLNRIPFGNQTVGAEAAARLYFARPAADLSLAESSFLAGLPNAPSSLNPYRRFDEARRRQLLVLRRMLDAGFISDAERLRAVDQPLRLVPPAASFIAPHAVELAARVVESRADPSEMALTIDAPLQVALQRLVKGHLDRLADRNVTNAAVVVIENRTGRLAALIGSADYFDDEHDGQVNGALALRQPGSAIKPFTYVLALEHGFTPATVIPDVPLAIPDHNGSYTPENYDRRYHGPVRLRSALACSYNIPAVRTAQALGLPALLDRYRLAGLSTIDKPADFYGFGLTLGNADVTLLDLTNAYAALARGGVWKPMTLIDRMRSADGADLSALVATDAGDERVIASPVAVALLTDILSDVVAKRPAFGNVFRFPFPCAVKTGTTKDFRDNWTLGYTSVYTVGVWAGNFDGTPMRGVSGITGAGSIFFDVMMTLHDRRTGIVARPFVLPKSVEEHVVCVRSGLRPTPSCSATIVERFAPGTAPTERCTVHRRFRFAGGNGDPMERVFEVYPREYEDWRRDQSIPAPPPGARLVAERTSSVPVVAPDRPAVLSPNSGDYFKLDPILRPEFQTVRVRAYLPSAASTAQLWVNGAPAGSISGGGTWWQLRKGTHRLQVRAMLGQRSVTSREIVVTVD